MLMPRLFDTAVQMFCHVPLMKVCVCRRLASLIFSSVKVSVALLNVPTFTTSHFTPNLAMKSL